MCSNYEPMRFSLANLIGMPEPTIQYKDHVWPLDPAPIIVKTNSGWEWREARFGLNPAWNKDPNFGRRTYNARTETLTEKPTFKTAFKHSQFCLIPAQRIFEPRYDEQGKSHWYAIEREDGAPFTIAGLYDFHDQNGQQVRSFTMLTRNAEGHPLMQQFHKPGDEKRSVIVIPQESRDAWMNASPVTAKDLFLEFPKTGFKTYNND